MSFGIQPAGPRRTLWTPVSSRVFPRGGRPCFAARVGLLLKIRFPLRVFRRGHAKVGAASFTHRFASGTVLGAALLGTWLSGSGVRAAEPQSVGAVRKVALSYVGTSGCPTEATFKAGLRRLTPGLDIGPHVQDDVGTLAISLSHQGEHFVGSLVYGETKREVTAASCADAAYAMAVVAAITLDPDGAREEIELGAEDFVEPEATPAAPEQPARPERRPEPKPAAPLPAKPAMADPIESLEHSLRSRWVVLGGAIGSWGEVDALAGGGALDVLFAGGSRLESVVFGLRAVTARRQLSVTTLEFTRVAAALQWCPRIAEGTDDGFRLYVCGGAELGWAKVSTENTAAFSGLAQPGEVSVLLGGELLWTVPLGSLWYIAVRPGLVTPLVRNEYVVEQSPGVTEDLVQHSRLVGRGLLQLGYSFE